MPQTFYVSPTTGTDTNTGTQQTPFKTITRALQIATINDRIQLAYGEYNTDSGEIFPLSIPVGLTIIGDEAKKGKGIVIEGSGNYLSRTFARQNVTFVLLNDAQLRGVTVTNPDSRGTAVWVESSTPTISNNTFTKCKREGVFATGNANPVIENNIFRENTANGISIAKNSQGQLRGNVCVNTGYGIAISDDTSPTLTDNQIYGNRSGIIVSGSSRPILRNNLIERNTDDGLTIIASSLPDIGSTDSPGGNIFRNNGNFDIQNASSNTLVSAGNEIDAAKVKGKIEFITISEPEPTPIPEPEPTPIPEPEPTPIPEPEPTPIPEPEPTPIPEPEPTPIPEPEPTPIPKPKPKNVLTDIGNHWAAAFIQELVKLDIIKGYPDRTFKPNATMTRGQYAALLVKAFNPPVKREAIKFKDVSERFWAFQVIQQAYQGQFLSGYPNQTFAPNQNIQRIQVIVSLVNGLGLSASSTNKNISFDDQAQIPNYGKDEVIVAFQKGMIVNYPKANLFNPTRDATRAEVAVMVYQALVDAGRVAAINSPYLIV